MIGLLTANGTLGVGPELTSPDAALVAGSGAAIVRTLRGGGHVATSLEEMPSWRALAASGGPLTAAVILTDADVRAALKAAGIDAVVPFKTSATLERVAAGAKIKLLAPPARLVRALENKLQLPALAAAAGVRFPRTERVQLDADLAARAGEFAPARGRAATELTGGDQAPSFPLVFQPATGFAGAGTVPVADADALRALVDAHTTGAAVLGKLTELIEGEPLTVNGVVLGPGDVIVGAPCHQLTGIAACSSMPLGSCGNDWSLPIGPAVAAAVRAACAQVGAALAEREFAGAFGIDVVATSTGDIVLIEINPRWTAGLSLGVQLQQFDAPGLTFWQAHLAAFDRAGDDIAAALRDRYATNLDAANVPGTTVDVASIILYGRSSQPALLRSVASGTYRIAGVGALERVDRNVHLAGLPDGADHVIVLAQPSGRALTTGEHARIIVRGGAATDGSARTLRPEIELLVDTVRSQLAAAPASMSLD